MRRAVIVLGSTAAGLAALLSFKTHSLAAPAPAAGPPAPTSGTPQAMASGTGSSATGSTAGQAASAAPKASATAPVAARTVTGTVANTQYGPMQVQVTLAGSKITKVTVLQRTDDGSESDQIDATAIPQLTSETLAAQSARIDAVSGASYTSSGYIQSLQSALDKA
ncbi:MAG: FMN-binding protein [Trebonia sp.]